MACGSSTNVGTGNGSMVMVDNSMLGRQQPVQQVQQVQSQSGYGQEMNNGGNEMYANFQQAQMQSYDDGGQQVSCCLLLCWGRF